MRKRKSGATAYDIAVHHGFPYIVTETDPIIKRGIFFNAFSQDSKRRKPWLYVGYNHKTRRWHIFGDQPLASGIPGVGQANPGARWHESRRREANQQDRMVKSDRLKEFFHGKSVAHLESGLAARAMGMNPGNFKVKIHPDYEYGGYHVEIWDKRTNQVVAWSTARTKQEAYKEAERLLAGRKNPRRPHGTFRSCVRKVSRQRPRVRDPKAVCGKALSRKYKYIPHPMSGHYGPEGVGRNPMAIYGLGNPCGRNPRVNGMIHAKIEGVIYNRLIEIKAQKTAFQPGYYRHPFSPKSHVKIYGLDNGDLLVHSTAGVKLWTPA